jgi:hypothetical protein
MHGWNDSGLFWPLFISNIAGLIILFFCWKHTVIGRILMLILFLWAGCTNWYIVTHNPKVYLEYADYTFLPIYKSFINGWFSRNILLIVGLIATGQLLIAISMSLKGFLFKLGALGGMIFLVGIIPLGIGSGFPFPIITAIAFFFLLRQNAHDYLWKKDISGRYKRKLSSKPG